MSDDFVKFPSTPHLAIMPGLNVRGDKVMSDSERNEFLQHRLIIEEKIDGANLGISFDKEGNICAQNRGGYLDIPYSGQWNRLTEWLALHSNTLFEHLSYHYILFGEWCYARHSVFYDRLPDWYLAFDIYDRESGRFMSAARRDCFLVKMKLNGVPIIERGHFSYIDVQKLLIKSKLSTQYAEGIYLRVDSGDWLVRRAKLVRSSFIQTIDQHWSRSPIQPNKLANSLTNDSFL